MAAPGRTSGRNISTARWLTSSTFQDRITADVAMIVGPQIQTGGDRTVAARTAGQHRSLRRLSTGRAQDQQGDCQGECGSLCAADAGTVARARKRALALPCRLGARAPQRDGLAADPDRTTSRPVRELARVGLANARREIRRSWRIAGCNCSRQERNTTGAWPCWRLRRRPTPTTCWWSSRAGIAHLHCGRVEDALAYFHRAIRLSPSDPVAHLFAHRDRPWADDPRGLPGSPGLGGPLARAQHRPSARPSGC